MKSNFFISKALSLSFCLLFLISCQTAKEKEYVYVSECKYLSKDSVLTGEIKLFLEGGDTVVVLVPDWDPMFKVGSTERDPGNTFKVGGLFIDYSNRDSIYGITIKNTVVRDTLVSMDPVSKSETIQVVENTLSDTLGSCIFKKTNVK